MRPLPLARFAGLVACGFVLLLGLAGVAPRSACAGGDRWRGVKPAGETERRTYDAGDFHSLSVDGVAEIDLEVGPDCLVELETDANFIDYVRVRERDGVLTLDQKNDLPNLSSDTVRFHFRITMPELKRLEVDGVAEIEGSGLAGGHLRIRADGVADIELKGEVEELDVEVDGVADLDLRRLSAEEARVRVDGVGNVALTVTDLLDASVDGMGEIEYYGDPEVARKSVDGFGSIKRR
jgi:hypothetical protein